MFWRILSDSVVRRKSRKALAIFAISVGISLVVALLLLGLDAGDKMSRELSSFGANIKVLPVSLSIPVEIGDYALKSSKDVSYLEEKDFPKLKEIFWQNNILGIVPRLWTQVQVNGTHVPLLGIWLDQKIPTEGGEPFVTGASKVYKHWAVQGHWPSKSDPNACLVGQDLAKKFNLSIGNQIKIDNKETSASLSVSGIVATGDKEDSAIIASIETVQRLSGLVGKVSEADISALTTPENKLAEKYRIDPKSLTPTEYDRWYCTPYPENVAMGIQEAIPNSAARVVRRISETQGAVLTRIQGLLFFLAVFTFIASALSVMGILASAVLDRRPEVALLQAIGAKRASVLSLFLVEVAALGIVGGLLGGMAGSWIGTWLIRVIFDSKPESHMALILLSPFLGLLIAWIGSFFPVQKALGEDIAPVLHGN